MFKRIASFFAAKPRDESVSVYYVEDRYFVATEYGAVDGGLACYVVGPVNEVSRPTSAADLGAAIFRGLDLCRYDFDAPETREDWKQVQFPVLQATRSKTWAALAKKSNSLTVRRLGSAVTVLPSRREKQGFAPIMERQVVLASPAAERMGEVVLSELDLARADEGPQ
jgi:hypothetical protein